MKNKVDLATVLRWTIPQKRYIESSHQQKRARLDASLKNMICGNKFKYEYLQQKNIIVEKLCKKITTNCISFSFKSIYYFFSLKKHDYLKQHDKEE